MKGQRIARYLEIASNAAVLVVALLIVGTLAAAYFMKTSKPRLAVGFRTGQTSPQISGVTYEDAPKTLLIAMSPKCAYCAASLPFYKKLLEAQSADHPATRIVGILPGSEQEIKEFVRQQQLNIETKVADLQTLGFNATPTLVLVDSHGKIINFWIGKLSSEAEAEVLKAITS